jgi:histidyl-tRNA synthetase
MIEQVKGTQNIANADALKFLHIQKLFYASFVDYGYSFLQTPHIEHTELFQKSIGENSEIVSKQMYQFEDKGGRSLVLRPEGTSSIARYHSQYNKGLTEQYAYFGQMFRYENPQQNRYREFTQGGVEIIGKLDAYSDLQIITDSIRFLKNLNIEFVLQINTIGSLQDRKNYSKDLSKYFTINKDKLSTESREKIELNTLRILDSNNDIDKLIIDDAPEILEYINSESNAKYEELKHLLRDNSVSFIENPKLVRGLDYYNDLTFEFIANNGVVIGGGGRYDQLSQILNIGSFEGVGVAFGIERILNILDEVNQNIDIFLIGTNINKITEYSKFLDEKNLSFYKPPRLSKLNAQFKLAKNSNAKYVINTDEDTIKDLENNKTVDFDIEVLIAN